MTSSAPEILGELSLDLGESGAEDRVKGFVAEVRVAAERSGAHRIAVARRVVGTRLEVIVVTNPLAGDAGAGPEALSHFEADAIERLQEVRRTASLESGLKAPSLGVGLRRR
ncbi:MAG: hypothetical protein AAFX94_08030 [Myxococcota bacterium]